MDAALVAASEIVALLEERDYLKFLLNGLFQPLEPILAYERMGRVDIAGKLLARRQRQYATIIILETRLELVEAELARRGQ